MHKSLLIISFSALLLSAFPVLAEDSSPREGRAGHRGEMLRAMDKDGDGAISRQEFMDGATARFAKMDRNGDGKISREDRPEGAGLRGGEVVPQVTTE